MESPNHVRLVGRWKELGLDASLTLVLFNSAMQLYPVSLFLFIRSLPESPRWYVFHDKTEEVRLPECWCALPALPASSISCSLPPFSRLLKLSRRSSAKTRRSPSVTSSYRHRKMKVTRKSATKTCSRPAIPSFIQLLSSSWDRSTRLSLVTEVRCLYS